MIPGNFKLQYSKEDIARRVKEMGVEISTWAAKIWQESHTDIIAIPILRGGIFFFADLVREINTSVEIAPVRTWAYQSGVNQVERGEMKVQIDGVPARGRNILLVDDICDSGRTLRVLKDEFLKVGALEVRSAVLIKRELEQQTFNPDWVGFGYQGSEWFVGYGMEDCERWRNLGSIHIIQQGVESKGKA